jgi:hypothetical protein
MRKEKPQYQKLIDDHLIKKIMSGEVTSPGINIEITGGEIIYYQAGKGRRGKPLLREPLDSGDFDPGQVVQTRIDYITGLLAGETIRAGGEVRAKDNKKGYVAFTK